MRLATATFGVAGWLVYSCAAAELPTHLCDGQTVERSATPFHVVRNGRLVSLIGRKLDRPVTFGNGTFRKIVLRHGPRDVFQFPYPGELYIQDQAGGKRIIHNHHVLTDGTYSAQANGWWVIDIDASGKAVAMGFNESFCYFRYVYEPLK